MNAMNRRDFLKISAAAMAAVGAGSLGAAAAPPARIPVTCRDAVFKATGKPDCWSAMKDLGVDGVEANVGIDMALTGMTHPTARYTLATPDGIAAFKSELEANKVQLVTFMMANRFDSRHDDEMAWMKRLAAAGKALGVRTIRIDLVPQKLKKDEFLPFAVRVGKEISAIAADQGVRLAIENHGNTTNDPEFLARLFDGVGAANLGLTLDTANFYWYGHPLEDLYKMFQRFAPRAFHSHCKSIKYPDDMKNVRREMGWKYREYTCPIYEGDIDFARFIGILRDAKFDGDLCLENESLEKFKAEERAGVLKREIALLRKLADA